MSSHASPPLPLSPASLEPRGHGLSRPECVLATASGDLYTADWRGGVAILAADGSQTLIGGSLPDGRPLRPNGIALERDGAFLLADLGDTEGGVFRLRRDGTVTPVVVDVDGMRLPPTNFVLVDAQLRLWITVSTRRVPRALGYRRDVADGFVVLVDERGARIVADGLGYTNEVAIDPDGGYLYVNETFARRTSRFAIRADGALGPRETFTEYGEGTFPDGLAFDEEGFLWVVSIVSNRVLRVAPDGRSHDLDRGRRRRARRVGGGCVPRGNARAAAPRWRRERASCATSRALRSAAPIAGPRSWAACSAMRCTPFARRRRESLPRIGTGRNPDDGDEPHVRRARRVAGGCRLSGDPHAHPRQRLAARAIARSSRSWHSRSA